MKPSLNARNGSAILSTLLVLFMLATHVLPSLGEGQIHVNGIAPKSTYINETVSVYGIGATPNSTVVAMLSLPANQTIFLGNTTGQWIFVGSDNLTLGSTFATESGDWEISFRTPNVFPGYYSVYALDNESLTSDVTSLQILMNVTVMPSELWANVTYFPWNMTIWIANSTGLPLLFYLNGTVVPASGPPGTIVTLLGKSASGGEIIVYFDDGQVATFVSQLGDWKAYFVIPSVSAGNHTIRAIDNAGRWMTVAPFYVTSSVISFSMSSLSLFGLFAIVSVPAIVFFMLLVMFRRKRK
jgi:hypothetical protein